MNNNTTSEKPFFRCTVPGCNFIGEGSITECPLCNARKEREQWFNKHPENYLFQYLTFVIVLDFIFSYIITDHDFNVKNWTLVFLGVGTGQFVIDPIVRKIYGFIKEKMNKQN